MSQPGTRDNRPVEEVGSMKKCRWGVCQQRAGLVPHLQPRQGVDSRRSWGECSDSSTLGAQFTTQLVNHNPLSDLKAVNFPVSITV